MKTDRELLELAAKAAGIKGVYFEEHDCGINYGERLVKLWNPLAWDGDALRLAVKLKLIIDPWSQTACTVRHRPSGSGRAKELFTCGVSGEGLATRRAIVCAAAAIGEANEKVKIPTA